MSRQSYVPLFELARGGMGTVEIVVRREGAFERLYAVKRLLPHLEGDPDVRQMFLDEARFAGLIRHPNVVSVVDVGEDQSGSFITMDFVNGLSLSDLLRSHAREDELVPIAIALEIALQIARGLAAVHETKAHDGSALDLVHRDVSPQNILVGFDGVVRLTDFGIAKALGQTHRTSTGVLKGKLAYMSPEQLRFRSPDARSDLFALGVVIYELVAGRQLYPAKPPEEAARRVLEEPPPDLGDERPDAPPALVDLLFGLLAKDPADRPACARDVVAELEAIANTHDRMPLAEYMETRFGEVHSDREIRIREALKEPPIEVQIEKPAESTEPDAAAPRRSGRAAWIVAALAITAASSYLAIDVVTSGSAAPGTTKRPPERTVAALPAPVEPAAEVEEAIEAPAPNERRTPRRTTRTESPFGVPIATMRR